ncbi:hypothetical protein [Trueperella sp. LYQ143]|uniref:hypothetical protein n=1 Tax=Trueperella sp. LYQ143 TaxID=3391059 RepID=UPI003983CB41
MAASSVNNFLLLWWKARRMNRACAVVAAVAVIAIIFSGSSVVVPIVGGLGSVPFRSFSLIVVVAILARAIFARTSFDPQDSGLLRRITIAAATLAVVLGSAMAAVVEIIMRLPYAPAWAAIFALFFFVTALSLRWIPADKVWVVGPVSYFVVLFVVLSLVELSGDAHTFDNYNIFLATSWNWTVIAVITVSVIGTPLAVAWRYTARRNR